MISSETLNNYSTLVLPSRVINTVIDVDLEVQDPFPPDFILMFLFSDV